MPLDVRLFQCALCHCQVQICKRCDRGHIYCSSCSSLARRTSTRKSSIRYQQSRRGRFNHAKRQQLYRTRQLNKVTHHSSPPPSQPSYSSLSLKIRQNEKVSLAGQQNCHFCVITSTLFLLNGFLRHQETRLNTKKSDYISRRHE